MTKLELAEGKYTVILHDNYTFEALRYGEKWRDLTGDGMVFAMFQELADLRNVKAALCTQKCDCGYILPEPGWEHPDTCAFKIAWEELTK